MSELNAILEREISGYSASQSALPFQEHGIDSFDLISIRVAVEQFIGRQIDDAVWTGLRSPADLIEACGPSNGHAAARTSALASRREHTIEMPQMAVGGLSESWLFKEIGDFHWSLITAGLNTPSGQMVDGNGDRLYATFTRIHMRSKPLKSYRENDPFNIDGQISRYGAGIFLGDFTTDDMSARVMSSFAKRAEKHSNKGLLKGQPVIGPDCPIPEIPKPEFADEYRQRRHQAFDAPLFECDYEINPYHDINGVGLIYFAAYPLISDTCELRYMAEGNRWASRASTISRDICYFANSDADDRLVYSVVSRKDDGDRIEIQSVISRKEDRTPMALVTTTKALL